MQPSAIGIMVGKFPKRSETRESWRARTSQNPKSILKGIESLRTSAWQNWSVGEQNGPSNWKENRRLLFRREREFTLPTAESLLDVIRWRLICTQGRRYCGLGGDSCPGARAAFRRRRHQLLQ